MAPRKLERCVKDVSKTGKSKSSSYAICTASLKKAKDKKMEKRPDYFGKDKKKK